MSIKIEIDESLAPDEWYLRAEPSHCPSCSVPRGCAHNYGCRIQNAMLPGQVTMHYHPKRVGRAADFIETGSE